MQIIDMIGFKTEMLTVVDFAFQDKRGIAWWKCECKCGTKDFVVDGRRLRNGNTIACGCLKGKRVPKTHGMSNTRIYNIWSKMHQRCENPKRDNAIHYYDRGIRVCDEWSGSEGFMNFYNWAMTNGYNENLTLDRKDPDGNYYPDNCRWADAITQCNNRTNNLVYTYQGKTQTLMQWSRELNFNYATVWDRIRRHGMSFEEAISKSLQKSA